MCTKDTDIVFTKIIILNFYFLGVFSQILYQLIKLSKYLTIETDPCLEIFLKCITYL